MISKILSNSSPYIFRGCNLSDNLPKHRILPKTGEIFIVNTLSSNDPIGKMGHFIAFIITKNILLYFDSFNLHPSVYGKHIEYFYNTQLKGRKIRSLGYRVQDTFSHVCGAHVIFFVKSLIRSNTLKSLFNRLKSFYSRSKYNINDRKVVKYVYNLRGSNLPSCGAVFCDGTINYSKCVKHLCRPFLNK